jgi:hypothetical protein
MLGALEPELDFAQQDAIAERLLASLPRCFVTGIALLSKCRLCAAVLDGLNRLVQAAEALLAGRPDPQTR